MGFDSAEQDHGDGHGTDLGGGGGGGHRLVSRAGLTPDTPVRALILHLQSCYPQSHGHDRHRVAVDQLLDLREAAAHLVGQSTANQSTRSSWCADRSCALGPYRAVRLAARVQGARAALRRELVLVVRVIRRTHEVRGVVEPTALQLQVETGGREVTQPRGHSGGSRCSAGVLTAVMEVFHRPVTSEFEP